MLILTLMGFLLAQNPEIQAPNWEKTLAEDLLLALPSPALVPTEIPNGYHLTDVRIHTQAHAHFGTQLTYTLVYASTASSFMFQSSLQGYAHPETQCASRPLLQRETAISFGSAWQAPRVLSLWNPACSLQGEALGSASLTAQQAQRIWASVKPLRPE